MRTMLERKELELDENSRRKVGLMAHTHHSWHNIVQFKLEHDEINNWHCITLRDEDGATAHLIIHRVEEEE